MRSQSFRPGSPEVAHSHNKPTTDSAPAMHVNRSSEQFLQNSVQEPAAAEKTHRHRRSSTATDLTDLEAQSSFSDSESGEGEKERYAEGSFATLPPTSDGARNSLGSDYEERVEIVKACDDVIWGALVWEENEAPTMDALMCFVCFPCMVPTTNDPETQAGKLARGKIAWRRLLTCTIVFTVLQAIILAVTCLVPPGIAPMQINVWYGPYPHVLSEFGAKNTALMMYHDEWWRLLSCTFLHAGVIHYALNALVLLKLGMFMEMRWGRTKWVIVYVVTGCYGTLCSCITSPDSLGVGASGAIMGMLGAWMADMMLAWENANDEQLTVYKRHLAIVLLTSVTTVLLIFIPAFDSAAHIGGLLSGCVLGMVLFASNLQDQCLRHSIALAGAMALSMMVCLTIWYLLNNVEPSKALLHYCQSAHNQDPDGYPSCG